MSLQLFTLLALLTVAVFLLARGRARAIERRVGQRLHSRPAYHGLLAALWCLIPALLVILLLAGGESLVVERLVTAALPESMTQVSAFQYELLINDIKALASGNVVSRAVTPELESAAAHYSSLLDRAAIARLLASIGLALMGAFWIIGRVRPDFQARNQVESLVRALLILCSALAVLTTIGIVLSVLFEAIRFFQAVPIFDFLFGLKWSPQTAIRADQVGGSGSFGAIPVFAGTLLISAIALLVAVPVGLMSAIYLSEYAGRRFRAWAKPLLEILAGIPTVVYGFFAALTVAPSLRGLGESVGLQVSSESALAAGLVMGIMIIPFISSLSDDVINAVPQSLRDGSYGLGATRSETIRLVILPAALPGIVGSVLLAASRAIGETMIVVMAAGLAANLTANPLQTVSTVTVQIVTLLVGDQEFDSAKTLAAFALGLVLFLLTLVLNIIALVVVRRYREQYD
ncbi:MAG: phosphate ABC transporter permease subunit PstC [Desulfobulbaceae bacterium]|uniref:Phosphate transport system permease protein n=1 Tax=Candidatus Desulfatifera sulfidica TaxID=2841691 RepID=A0A8J6N883_9BACT|nr:phosphate ABC transporter permease subunit PstC [Candidatus Desulfatifera sulfidica]